MSATPIHIVSLVFPAEQRGPVGAALLAAGYQVTEFDNPDAAVGLLKNGPCDILVASYQLPGSNCLDWLVRLHATAPRRPVFILGDDLGLAEAVRAMRLRVIDILHPNEPVLLVERITALVKSVTSGLPMEDPLAAAVMATFEANEARLASETSQLASERARLERDLIGLKDYEERLAQYERQVRDLHAQAQSGPAPGRLSGGAESAAELEKLRRAKASVEAQQRDLTSEKILIREEKEHLRAHEADLSKREAAVAEKLAMITSRENELAARKAELAAYEKVLAQHEAELAAKMEAAAAAEQAKAGKDDSGRLGGGRSFFSLGRR